MQVEVLLLKQISTASEKMRWDQIKVLKESVSNTKHNIITCTNQIIEELSSLRRYILDDHTDIIYNIKEHISSVADRVTAVEEYLDSGNICSVNKAQSP